MHDAPMGRRRVSTGVVFLVLGYVLSQFYRAFLAVLAPFLMRDLGVGADSLAWASGLWFVAFALAQLPIGWALDRIGPRLTAAVPLAVLGGGGAFCFALAQGPIGITVAMVLTGLGCAPVLVAAYYIYAREYPPALFATLAGMTVGIGSFGNIAGTLPLAWAAQTYGWRAAVAGVGVVTLLAAAALWRFVHDPAPVARDGDGLTLRGLLRERSLWLLAPMMVAGYAPAADIRGLWVGPWLGDVYGLDAGGIGRVSLVMGLAMIAGNFLYGPLDRVIGSRKWGVFGGNVLACLSLLAMGLWPAAGLWQATLGLAALGVFGASYSAVMAHGRGFLPPHLVGRGVTLLTLVGIGGTGLMQVVTGRIHAAWGGAGPIAPYSAIFLFFAGFVALTLGLYLFTEDRLD
ncbi:MFS transporter [Defluviimonas sp. 20V17]|nr:MFS transporter [Defluviimonas sp. 20V17]